jgi:hypothetical protein
MFHFGEDCELYIGRRLRYMSHTHTHTHSHTHTHTHTLTHTHTHCTPGQKCCSWPTAALVVSGGRSYEEHEWRQPQLLPLCFNSPRLGTLTFYLKVQAYSQTMGQLSRELATVYSWTGLPQAHGLFSTSQSPGLGPL